jgi:hypothetical protein
LQTETASLLKQIAFNAGTVQEAKRRFSNQLAPDFSIFDFFKSDEMALSRCLASLLDPQGRHGQGSLFLRLFVENLPTQAGWIRQFEKCAIKTEKQALGQRRIDVYLEFPEGLIGIENKPWATDQALQLSDYADYLSQTTQGNNWLLIYLCNDAPSHSSLSPTKRQQLLSNQQLIELNYEQLLHWLGICRQQTQALNVRIFIEELIKFVRIHINGELDMSVENEVRQTILASKSTLASAFMVSKAMHAVKSNLMQGFHKTLREALSAKGLSLVWDKNMDSQWKPSTGFGIQFSEDQDLCMRVEFEGHDLTKLIWGIRRHSTATPSTPDRWRHIAAVMESEFGPEKQSDWWPWYCSDTTAILGNDLQDWGQADFLWTHVMQDQGRPLAEQLVNAALRVKDLFTQHMDWLKKIS